MKTPLYFFATFTSFSVEFGSHYSDTHHKAYTNKSNARRAVKRFEERVSDRGYAHVWERPLPLHLLPGSESTNLSKNYRTGDL